MSISKQLPYDRACYAAFKAKDARFDGRFFVGVASTGIYCRPICPARLPKPENCAFYPSAAAAEQAGYRPCLLCRPEKAPGAAPVDAKASLARKAAKVLEENCGSGQSMAELATELGCTDRTLRRAFKAAYGVSPIQYLQTCRLLLAKNLLTDSTLSVTQTAMASGFGSLRRFNDLFQKRYRLSPGALRKRAANRVEPNPKSDTGPGTGPGTGPDPGSDTGPDTELSLTLSYRPPYNWPKMLEFLALRAIPGVERVTHGSYARTVSLVDARQKRIDGWIRLKPRPQKNSLAVTLSPSLLPVLPLVLGRVRAMFDLDCDPQALDEGLASLNLLLPGLYQPGTRLPGCFEPFEMCVRAILGQLITVKAAVTLAGRLAQNLGPPAANCLPGLTHFFPDAAAIAALGDDLPNQLGPLGIIRSKSKTIMALARLLVDDQLDFNPCLNPEAEIKKLLAIPGIGVWTAQYIALRAMSWPDAFLHTDYGIKKALAPRSATEILDLAEAWRPWRGYAMINIWNSL